jgi:hypothetical protein
VKPEAAFAGKTKVPPVSDHRPGQMAARVGETCRFFRRRTNKPCGDARNSKLGDNHGPHGQINGRSLNFSKTYKIKHQEFNHEKDERHEILL